MRRAYDIEWDFTDDMYADDIDNYDETQLPTIVAIPDEIEEDMISDWLSDTYGFCVVCYYLTKDFDDLTADEVWELRQQVTLNSIYVADYENTFGYNPELLSDFFDGYVSTLMEMAEEHGGEWTDYDNIDNLDYWRCQFEDFSWMKIEGEE